MEIRIRAFTLIEVVVVVGVIAVIAAVTLSSFPEFSERVGIEQEAGKLVLSLRKAQSYALAVREFQPGSGVFPPYGVSISTGDRIHYNLFADFPNKNYRFDEISGELVEKFSVEKRVEVKEICGNSQSVPQGSCALSLADIVYERPGPTISLIGVDGGLALSYNDIKVVLRSLDGSIQKNVIIWSTGQISIE
ncbi:MAG TPA: prepilin-type N-terminal cleavage/methylation domain-containing protein [Candidatus Paceibacterota bacterium]